MDTNIARNAAVRRRAVARAPGPIATAAAATAAGVPSAVWALLWRAGAPDTALVDDLQALLISREFPAGSLLMSRHEPALELLMLVQGAAALGRVQDGVPFQSERSLQAPEWLDPASAWLGGLAAQDAVALTDVRLLALPLATLQPLLLRHPALAGQLLRVLARQVQQLTGVARDLMHKDAQARLADWLLQRRAAFAASPDTADAGGDALPQSTVITLHERKRDIAAQLGITPETLSRLLRQLTREGLLEVKGYSVALRDLAALRRIAAG